jgi:LacI family transcriptional regulator
MPNQPVIGIGLPANVLTTAEIFRGVGAYAEKYGPWRFHILSKEGLDFARMVESGRDDGYILEGRHQPWPVAERPIVGVVGTTEAMGVPSVETDDHAVGRLGAEHLIERGLAHLAYWGVQEEWSEDRRQGFVARAEQAIQTGRAQTVTGFVAPRKVRFTDRTGVEVELVDRWLASLDRPAGVMCCDDQEAQQVMDGCIRLGLHVPTEIALLGVNDNEVICRFTPVPLSSVNRDRVRLGYEAARLLHALMDGRPVENPRVLVEPTGVTGRASTDLPISGDPVVSRAVHFIRDNARAWGWRRSPGRFACRAGRWSGASARPSATARATRFVTCASRPPAG